MKRIIFIALAIPILLFSQGTAHAITATQRKLLDSGVKHVDEEAQNVCSASLPIANGSVDRFLQVLSFQESRGNPTAQNGTSSASGKYQYINSTWQARASLYGPAGQYAQAKLAPEEIQDAVAYIEYTQKFNDLGHDLFKLAVSHYLPVALTNEAKMDQIPSGGNKMTPRQYGEMLIQNIGKGVGSDIQLKYGQAPEFSTWLEKVGGAPPTVNASTPSASTGGNCASTSGSSIGGSIVEIAQRELAGGANEADSSYLKYTGGTQNPDGSWSGGARVQWCAYFVSWVFNDSGKPLEGGPYPAVAGILALAKNKGWFHDKNEAGFTPQPGDVAIYKQGQNPYPSHVNIVISYDAASAKYTSIGGNESNTIKQANISIDSPALTGFMRVP